MTILDTNSIDQLRELIGGDEAELIELIELFQVESGVMLNDMKLSCQTQDVDLLRRSAHSLKSSSQDFGAIQLSELNATLESNCRNGWPDSAEQLIMQITKNFELVDESLTSYLSR